jgi:glycosyltransferase involved in cell wall biosynthesis
MKSIKVHLQYPWKFPDSPYYKYLIDNPPEGIKYINAEKQKGVITNKKFFWFSNFLKKNIRKSLSTLNLSLPNARLSPRGNYDLIHCAHCLSLNKNRPWVADIESFWQLYLGKKTKKSKEKVKKILISNNCKKILPWTQITANEIIKEFPEIKEKVEVVYPAVPVQKFKRKKNKRLKIIFIARYFDIKGGIVALKVLEKLGQKYGVEGIVISNVPENIKKRYSKLKIYDLMPQEKLFELMQNSDLFLYPGSADTFGFSLLEAMAFGLPIITINTKGTISRKELIENNKIGLIFDIDNKINFNKIGKIEEEIINKLIENCSKLIENKKLREKMSKNSIEIVKNGKFSIKERNRKLKKIYEESLR